MSDFFVLDFDSPEVQYLCQKDKRLAKVISMVGPIKYETYARNPFEFLVHEIIEQMLSIKAANIIFSRLVKLCDGKIDPKKISDLTIEQIRSTGTSRAKANCIIGITKVVINGELKFEEFDNLRDEEIIQRLTLLRGVGTWTAKMF